MDKSEYSRFAQFLRQMDKKEIDEKNLEQLKKDRADFEDFKKKLSQGVCKYCKMSINFVNVEKPCLHWLARPPSVKTKQLPKVFHKFGYYSSSSYLRWLATTESFVKNINDYSDAESEVIIHETIRYREAEWTIQSKKGDFEGHSGAINFPHFHVQLIINGRVNLSFNSEHYKLNDHDHWVLSMSKNHPDVFHFFPTIAPSAKTVFENLPLEEVVKWLETPSDGGSGNVRIETFLEAKDGKTISGDLVAKMIEDAKSRNKPIASLVNEYFPDANISQVLSPSDDTPENYERSGRGRKIESRPRIDNGDPSNQTLEEGERESIGGIAG